MLSGTEQQIKMLSGVENSITKARDSFAKESKQQVNREKIQAIRGAIQSITIWFEPIGPDEPLPKGRVRKNGSKPVRIVITPTVGEPIERGCTNGLVSRVGSRGKDSGCS